MKMNGKGPRVLVGVRVVTLLGGWKSLEPGEPPVNKTVYAYYYREKGMSTQCVYPHA